MWLLYTGHVCRQNRGPWKGVLWDGLLVPLLPGLFYFFPSLAVSLSGNGVHVIGCEDSGKWPYLALLRCLRQKKGGGVEATTKILWIFHSGSTCWMIPPSQTQEREEAVLINNPRRSRLHLRKHVTNQLSQAVVWLWLAHLSQLIRKGCSDVAAELSPGLTCEKQVVQLPTSGPRQARLCCLWACMNIHTCTAVFL